MKISGTGSLMLFLFKIQNDVLNQSRRARPCCNRAMIICVYFYAKVLKYVLLKWNELLYWLYYLDLYWQSQNMSSQPHQKSPGLHYVSTCSFFEHTRMQWEYVWGRKFSHMICIGWMYLTPKHEGWLVLVKCRRLPL